MTASIEPITSLDDPLEEPIALPYNSRVIAFTVILILGVALLLVQLYRIQIVQGKQFLAQADNNRFREESVPPPRGVIYDRLHVVLARNQPSYTIGIIPADLPSDSAAQRQVVFENLGALLSVSPASIGALYDKAKSDPFTLAPVKSRVSQDLAFRVEERHLSLPGVHIQLDATRQYVLGPAAASILGYVGPITDAQYQRLKDEPGHRYTQQDSIGQTGLEATFENDLHGTPGQRRSEVDATGREVRVLGIDNPVSGHNLVLTIDSGLQQAIADILKAHASPQQVASVVAMDPNNGQVLALVDSPSYDDNLFARGIGDADLQNLLNDPRHPLVSNAFGAAYPPGETFELVTAAAALQEKVITPTQQLDCSGYITVPNRYDPTIMTQLPDKKAYGQQDVISALADSCNVFFYQLGGGEPSGKWPGLDVNRLSHYAQAFGLGAPTGIDLVGEIGGVVPSVRWKRQVYNQEWVPMDTYEMSVGSGYMTVTPLQMANLASAVANGGTLYRPQLVLSETDDQGNEIKGYTPDVLQRIEIDPRYFQIVRDGMVAATQKGKTPTGTQFDGTAQAVNVPGLTIAGKPGTVPFGPYDKNGNRATSGWFIGFAPADHPQIAIAVFLKYGTGETDAAQVAHDIFAYWMQHRH